MSGAVRGVERKGFMEERVNNMGSKYVIRTREVRFFPLKSVAYTDYYTNSIFEFIKLLVTKRKYLIFATKHYF